MIAINDLKQQLSCWTKRSVVSSDEDVRVENDPHSRMLR